MAIEREFKFILKNSDKIEQELNKLGAIKIDINQGYLGKGGRVRRRVFKDKTDYIFTYKVDLKDQPGCLEIEKDISKEDFTLAWNQATHKIEKTRYVFPDQDGYWEVDLFRDNLGVYFVMAEFEKLDGPPEIHPLIEKFLILAADETDGRFKNRNLNTREKTKKILKKLK